jgi:PPK2 family polyphosphate:nucleotide phosphotransferase
VATERPPRTISRKQQRKTIADFIKPLRVPPGAKVDLGKAYDPGYKADFLTKADGRDLLEQGIELLVEYQDKLAAQDTYGLLVVIQALDAAGKDGTIKHVFSGVNPQGVKVHSFKAPSAEERDHDYLWRCATKLPARGEIAIFNRSHYEEVLVLRVHPELLNGEHLPGSAKSRGVWARRYREINDWERYLVDNGIHVVKLFLNLSREEQRERFLARIDRPEKNWKFSAADARERDYWDDYQKAYSQALAATSTEWAPWHVIPADHKWFARLSAAAVIADALMTIDPQYPTVSKEAKASLQEVKVVLEGEAPPGVAADPVEAALEQAARAKSPRGKKQAETGAAAAEGA